MSNWLNQLQSLLGQQGQSASSGERQEGKSFLLPGALGGLAGLLVASKSSRKLLAKYGTSALLVGGGAVAGSVLWNKYQQKLRESAPASAATPAAPSVVPAPSVPPSTGLDARSERLILALVFAAKSDGHIDGHERANIEEQLRAANIDVQGRVLIDRALAQPLDPQRLAQGISSEQEALEVYYISCAVIDIDHFMERSYLNALGEALRLPAEVRTEIEQDIQAQKQALST
ncbi:tellurite resistance TerB family protein [Klebsiella sp. R390]|uniref:tellurite resistance TerB family protein n=1 Tax=Klebsiella sp. R390 TaxID=2755400 RepID=UPI003DA9F6DB